MIISNTNRPHQLKQTYSHFSLKGYLAKIGEDGFFDLRPAGGEDGRKKGYARCSMSVKTSTDNTVYGVQISGSEQDTVRYSYKLENSNENFVLDWKDRYNKTLVKSQVPDGIDPKLSFGVGLGLERATCKDQITGQMVEYTVKKQLTNYDAVYEIKNAIESGALSEATSLYVNGSVKPNTYKDKNGDLKKGINLEVSSMGFAAVPVVFDEMTEEDLKTSAVFSMDVVVKEFSEVEGVTYLTGIYVGYDCIEEMEFKFANEALANTFKNAFNPYLKKGIYPMIKCEGQIKRESVEEEVVVDDGWGERVMKTRKAPSRQTYVITFGDSSTIDTESYTEENVETAKKQCLARKRDYNDGKDVRVENATSTDDWGMNLGVASMDDFDDDESWD